MSPIPGRSEHGFVLRWELFAISGLDWPSIDGATLSGGEQVVRPTT